MTDNDGNAPLSQACEIDVGGLLCHKIHIKSLSQAEKLNVLTNHYKPGTDFAFPKVMRNGCNRTHGLFTARNVMVASVWHVFSFPRVKK